MLSVFSMLEFVLRLQAFVLIGFATFRLFYIQAHHNLTPSVMKRLAVFAFVAITAEFGGSFLGFFDSQSLLSALAITASIFWAFFGYTFMKATSFAHVVVQSASLRARLNVANRIVTIAGVSALLLFILSSAVILSASPTGLVIGQTIVGSELLYPPLFISIVAGVIVLMIVFFKNEFMH